MNNRTRRSLGWHLLASVVSLTLLTAGVGRWAMVTEISGAVIASGQLVVDSSVKKVQHPTGGVVGELKVREGHKVKENQVLVRLDETQTRANLEIILKGLDDLSARQAREQTEREGAPRINFPPELSRRQKDPDIARLLDGEQRLFETRQKAREGQKAQLREQIKQLQDQIQGFTNQANAKVEESQWISRELKGVNELWEKRLIPYNRVTALQRNAAQIGGEHGSLIASLAQAKGKIAETELRILQIDEELRSEVGKDLADIRGKIAELNEKRITAEDQLKRVDIRSPQAGTVHQLAIHTIGGVVSPSEPIMLIVPESDKLVVEAKVLPQDIDQLHVGQAANLRFSSFNQRTTPELDGKVLMISADVTQDPKTNTSFYTIRLDIPASQLLRLKEAELVPGMPVEAFIQTQPRTVISYLVKPLADQITKAFREK